MSTDAGPDTAADESIVPLDATCRGCGYNLRGLPVAGQCPECGARVELSIRGDDLRHGDPRFVRRLRRGITLILIGVFAATVVGVVEMLSIASFSAQYVSLIELVSFAVYLPIPIGTWLLTTPDPGGIGEDQYGASRRFVRWTLAIAPLSIGFNYLMYQMLHLGFDAQLLVTAISFLAAMIGVAGQFAELNYLRKLATRIPEPGLSKLARHVMWGFGISYGAFVAIDYVALFMGQSLHIYPYSLGMVIAIAAPGVVSLVYAIIYVVILFRLGLSLNRQLVLAREAWAATALAPHGEHIRAPINGQDQPAT